MPFICYWGTCLLLDLFKLGQPDETKLKLNIVSKTHVFINVIASTLSYCFCNMAFVYFELFRLDPNIRFLYIIYGIILLDTVEYIMHYNLHKYKFLYKFHKVHHEVNISYNYCTLYNSLTESIIETIMVVSSFYFFNFSFLEYIIVFTLGNICGVYQHSDFGNLNKFHYLHHSKYQNYNFQQPFFTYWDRILGTYKV